MAYGHAERNLALIRLLEAETRQLLGSLGRRDHEQSACLQDTTSPRQADGAPGPAADCAGSHRGDRP